MSTEQPPLTDMPFDAVLSEFYTGEVAGEAIYSELLATYAGDPLQRYKLAALLQLETEAKAWLRPHMVARGLDFTEAAADRARGAEIAARLKSMPWPGFVQALSYAIDQQLVPRFQSFLDGAVARGDSIEREVCQYMLDHEKAQGAFARCEMAGERVETALADVTALLRYQLGPPPRPLAAAGVSE